MLNVESFIKNLEYRGRTTHYINCHIQDIPENGADIKHFKYVHTEVVPKMSSLGFKWEARWRTGDDPDVM
jgi:cholesterol 7-dehydrogenase